MWKLTISMAIFNSYVKLPEGTSNELGLHKDVQYICTSLALESKMDPEEVVDL